MFNWDFLEQSRCLSKLEPALRKQNEIQVMCDCCITVYYTSYTEDTERSCYEELQFFKFNEFEGFIGILSDMGTLMCNGSSFQFSTVKGVMKFAISLSKLFDCISDNCLTTCV